MIAEIDSVSPQLNLDQHYLSLKIHRKENCLAT